MVEANTEYSATDRAEMALPLCFGALQRLFNGASALPLHTQFSDAMLGGAAVIERNRQACECNHNMARIAKGVPCRTSAPILPA